MMPSTKKRNHQRNGNGNSVQPAKRIARDCAAKAIAPRPLLTDLPEEILRRILRFAQPEEEHERWEWADTVGLTCKTFMKMARDLAPQSLDLTDFLEYCVPKKDSDVYVLSVDLPCQVLAAFCASRWKGARLKELHVSWGSILDMNPLIIAAVKELLSTSGTLPNLKWLDVVSVGSGHVSIFPLVDADLLLAVPLALPKLKELCLAGCFDENRGEVSPIQLKQFARALQSPLESLSLVQVPWLSDAHVEAMISVVGSTLIRLELIDCSIHEYNMEFDTENIHRLTDATMANIARECRCLQSFSITDSAITSSGLMKVLEANTGIHTLDLSQSHSLRDAASIISKYSPKLIALRSYCGGENDWLSDEGIQTIINGQMLTSNGKEIHLKTIGLGSNKSPTNQGIAYALARGVSTIEASDPDPRFHNSQKFCIQQLSKKFPGAHFIQEAYPSYVDGSLYYYQEDACIS